MDSKKFRQIIREELEPIDKRLGGVGKGLDTVRKDVQELNKDFKELSGGVDTLKKEVKEMSENVDAARGDIESLHLDVKWIKEKECMSHSRNKREIDESLKGYLTSSMVPFM